MIQRVQSLWLVLAVCCIALCFMFPVAKYQVAMPATGQTAEARLDLVAHDNPDMFDQIQQMAPVVEYSQKTSGFYSWPLIVLAALTVAVMLLCIFLFGNRVRQMRIVAVAFLLNVAYVFLLFFWAVDAYGKEFARVMAGSGLEVTWFVGAYAPIVSLVFLILAHRGIKKDEAKVRAADRLR